jgi:hypothetical protein
MNDGIETGGDQLAEGTDIAEVAGEKLDLGRGPSESLRIKIIHCDIVLLGQELVDNV